MSTGEPIVSVVIPTRGRPRLLARAIASVSAQSFQDFEVLVVVDGPDPETEAMLAGLGDPCVRTVVNAVSVGGAEARNVGARAARGRWIAFLDDDDEWLPAKLETQLRAVAACPAPYPVGYSRLIARSPDGDLIGPRRPVRPGEPISDYMLARNSPFAFERLIQTTTMFVPRALLLEEPFCSGLRSYQETDWLLRVAGRQDVALVFSAQPLAVWHVDERRQTVTSTRDWAYSLDWIRERRHLVTPRAYAAFLLVQVMSLAASAGHRRVAVSLWREAWREGRPAPIDVLLFAAVWLVPADWRRRVRTLVLANRGRSAASSAADV